MVYPSTTFGSNDLPHNYYNNVENFPGDINTEKITTNIRRYNFWVRPM